jgi:hypothetical protein
MDFTELFSAVSPCVLGFISKLSVGPSKPHFPPIFGTGFFVHPSGIAATNRHVIEAFSRLPQHPKTGESSLAAVAFFPGDDDRSWQMLLLDPVGWISLSEFSSSDEWFGETTPDLGFVQMGVRDVPYVKLATEDFYVRIGMPVGTIGYPLGTVPLTVLGKLNQASPSIRHGIVSSVFPFPAPRPHGFSMDIMQQGGSSGSPVFRVSDGAVVGMMSSSVLDWQLAQSEQAMLSYSTNTNISICEPAHIIEKALREFMRTPIVEADKLPTLADLKAQQPNPGQTTPLTWDSFKST